jgi:hypothetical protein
VVLSRLFITYINSTPADLTISYNPRLFWKVQNNFCLLNYGSAFHDEFVVEAGYFSASLEVEEPVM